MEFVCYIAKTRKDKYKPFVGKIVESEGDDDSFIFALGNLTAWDTLKGAREVMLKEAPKDAKIYLNPYKVTDGILWVSELEKNEQLVYDEALEIAPVIPEKVIEPVVRCDKYKVYRDTLTKLEGYGLYYSSQNSVYFVKEVGVSRLVKFTVYDLLRGEVSTRKKSVTKFLLADGVTFANKISLATPEMLRVVSDAVWIDIGDLDAKYNPNYGKVYA
jgi:hypothetical protein